MIQALPVLLALSGVALLMLAGARDGRRAAAAGGALAGTGLTMGLLGRLRTGRFAGGAGTRLDAEPTGSTELEWLRLTHELNGRVATLGERESAAHAQLEHSNEMLSAIADAQSRFIASGVASDALGALLQLVLRATACGGGLIAEAPPFRLRLPTAGAVRPCQGARASRLGRQAHSRGTGGALRARPRGRGAGGSDGANTSLGPAAEARGKRGRPARVRLWRSEGPAECVVGCAAAGGGHDRDVDRGRPRLPAA